MNTLEQSVTKFLGRQPSDRELQDYYRARDAFDLKDNDALWLVLIALHHYETLYGQWPARIRDAAKETLADVHRVAQTQMQAAAEVTKQELADAVARTADQVATQTAATRMLKWAAGCFTASMLCLVIVGWFFYRRGVAVGDADGYQRGADQKAAAAWSNTAEGQIAYALAKAGDIRELAACSGRGWIRRGALCYPRSENGQVYGWRIPAEPKTGR